MIRFDIRESKKEIAFSDHDKQQIRDGFTVDPADMSTKVMESFETKSKAMRAFNSKYIEACSILKKPGTEDTMIITEYYVQENEYDDDGNQISCGEIWEYSLLPESV